MMEAWTESNNVKIGRSASIKELHVKMDQKMIRRLEYLQKKM